MRKLLLLCYPGERNVNELPQVRAVIERYRNYFQSPVGGFWGNYEIITEPQTLNYIEETVWISSTLQTLNNPMFNYTMIVFVGHGGIINQEDHIQLPKGTLLPLSQLLAPVDAVDRIKRTIIIDACRSFVGSTQHQLILEQRQYSEEEKLIGIRCRDFYNRKIAEIAPHVDLIQSTAYGDVAHATPIGSAYSDAFFETITSQVSQWNANAMAFEPKSFTSQIMNYLTRRFLAWVHIISSRR